ncbi:hypothetical protein ACHAXS_007949 [Conticribra weissflogii]
MLLSSMMKFPLKSIACGIFCLLPLGTDGFLHILSPYSREISSSTPWDIRKERGTSARQLPIQRDFQSIGIRQKPLNLSFLPDLIICSSKDYVFPSLDENNEMLLVWVLGFASSHIGISAIRTKIISSLGETANNLRLVGNSDWTLPGWWPGDNSGGNQIFPDVETAGRQFYRALYTIVSFITLGSAFGAYLRSSRSVPMTHVHFTTGGGATGGDSFLCYTCLATAALSLGAAIASLFNASPLGLMPGFESDSTTVDITATTGRKSIGGFRRDDGQKFTTRGLTRITRHPLILPVAPWGCATGHLAGGRLCDYILFGGLSLYAIAGCAAQDLRVIREEGSVGTVFRVNGLSDEKKQLSAFFEETSFVPFKAVFDGRQKIGDIVREVPWIQFFFGTFLGIYIEESVLRQLFTWSNDSIN